MLTKSSDTVAVALTEIFILLAMFPLYVASIRAELDTVIEESRFSCQASYPALDSFINETLRLYPAALQSSQKVTPPQGITIGTVHIPGDTVVNMSPYQLHRDPRNFRGPTEFIPERWTTEPEMTLNRNAYIAFSMGKQPSHSA